MTNTIIMPEFGIQGLPAGTKDNLRADFRYTEFEKMIEVKGYRLAWERAAMCPCKPINDQTKQSDPNCTLCKGIGWLWFGPENYVIDEASVGVLDPTQRKLLANFGAAVIKGIMTNLNTQFEPYDKLGHWFQGMSVVTVRWQNKLGYYDRIYNLDSDIVYSETFDQGADPTASVRLRYLVKQVNLIRSLDTIYGLEDFTLDAGLIKWLPGKAPRKDTRVAVHYLTYPVWLIAEHPHTIRQTNIKRKVTSPEQPLGNPVQLPIQAACRYEFIQP